MDFKQSVVQIYNMSVGMIAAEQIIRILEGKTFDVVSSHSGHTSGQTTLESVRLKQSKPDISGTLIKILLEPRRSLSFDIIEKPAVIFESPRQIVIKRRLSDGNYVIRTILVKE